MSGIARNKIRNETNWHALSIDEVAQELKSDFYRGLSEEEATKRRQEFGLNKLPEENLYLN